MAGGMQNYAKRKFSLTILIQDMLDRDGLNVEIEVYTKTSKKRSSGHISIRGAH